MILFAGNCDGLQMFQNEFGVFAAQRQNLANSIPKSSENALGLQPLTAIIDLAIERRHNKPTPPPLLSIRRHEECWEM